MYLSLNTVTVGTLNVGSPKLQVVGALIFIFPEH